MLPGIDFLKEVKLYGDIRLDGKKVSVIGGGNTAIDAARTAIRIGASSVTILYRRSEAQMPAYREEVEEAIREGVKIEELVSPLRFIAADDGKLSAIECMRRRLTNSIGREEETRLKFPSNFIYDTDVAIVAISQNADLPFIKKEDIGITHLNIYCRPRHADDYDRRRFAGGDIVRGPHEVITAIADGKHAASNRPLSGRQW